MNDEQIPTPLMSVGVLFSILRMTRVGIEPTTYGLTCHFDFRRHLTAEVFVVWTVP